MFGLCAPSKGSPTQITPRDARPCAGPGIAWGSHGHRCTRRSVRVVRAGPVDPRCQAPPSGCRRFMGAVTGGGGCARPPATFWDPSRGRSCRGRAGVVRGGRFEIGEREGGAGWWPVEASLFGAEALGGTGPQGSRCAANPGHSTIVRSGHGWDLEQACQAVREHGEDQRHLELSEGRQQEMAKAGSFAAACEFGRTDLEVCGHGRSGRSKNVPSGHGGDGVGHVEWFLGRSTTPRTLCPW